MISSLPNRPLSKEEADGLSNRDDIELVFPATPQSIRADDDGNQWIHDVLLFMGETVVAIAYLESEGGWSVIATADDEAGDAYETVYDALLEHRGYEDIDREGAMQQVVTKLYGIPPELIEANPEKLESLGDN
jgi:hypothetical protein